MATVWSKENKKNNFKYTSVCKFDGKFYFMYHTSLSNFKIIVSDSINSFKDSDIFFDLRVDDHIAYSPTLCVIDDTLCTIGGDGEVAMGTLGRNQIDNRKVILSKEPLRPYLIQHVQPQIKRIRKRKVKHYHQMVHRFDCAKNLIKFNGKYFLYNRLNICTGKRKVRVTISDNLNFNNKPFYVIDTKYYNYYANIFMVNDTFYGLFLSSKFVGEKSRSHNFVVLYSSKNGIDFGPIKEDLFPGRTMIYPSNGFIENEGEIHVFFYDHPKKVVFRKTLSELSGGNL